MGTTKREPMGRGYALSIAGIMGAGGLMLLWFAASAAIPSEAELEEVRGALGSYSCRGKAFTPVCDLTLQNGSYFWTDALYRSGADELFRGKPVEIRAGTKEGKGYGLWVNGSEIRTNEYALRRDWVMLRLIIPLLGCAMLAFAVLYLFRSTRTSASS